MSLAGTRLAPPRDCALCPRLAAYRAVIKGEHPDWHNAPVASFGDPNATLLIVGLAPGVSGANRTGRPFTGDFAGEILYPALVQHGFGRGVFDARTDDGLELVDARITNAVRCVPPQNRPSPAEIKTCRPFLETELVVPHGRPPEIVLTLGRIAHESSLRALGRRPGAHPFRHGGISELETGPTLVASYHTSRYNINTNRLTRAMFGDVMKTVRGLVDRQRA